MTPSAAQLITLPWQEQAISRYAQTLSSRPWTMLLHSGNAQHPCNRFDILLADPLVTLQTRGEHTEVYQIQRQQRHHYQQQDPFSLLQHYLQQYTPPLPPSCDDALPFQGGAVGLFGYDLARQLEQLPRLAQADIALPDMAVAIYDWALIADHQQQQLRLFSLNDVQQRWHWLQAQHPAVSRPFALTRPWQSNLTRQQYGEKFRQVQEYLFAGDCYQVNLAHRFQACYQGDEWQAFTRLNAACRAPFSAFLRFARHSVLSLSPERFLSLRQGVIETRPIKGTLPRLADPVEDSRQAVRLANSAKDRAENLMIVDLMRNDIGRVAIPGSVRVPELFAVEPFPAVHHLVSTVCGQLPAGRHACDLLRACFPGGSVTGAPKIRAMQIIEQLEPVRRNAWCGSIGYISFCGTMDTSITIRTLITDTAAQRIYCAAGGGIVADSDEQAEYDETLAKVQAMLSTLEA